MAITFEDSQVINRSEWFVGGFPGPGQELTPEQQVKMDSLKSLLSDVGEMTLDEELDVLIAAMTEIRDRQ